MSPVNHYFTGEKSESYLFLVLGVVGFVLSIYLVLFKTSSFWKGMAIPFISVSILEIIVGATLIYRSPKDIIRVEQYIKYDQSKIKTDEMPRMEKVMRNFVVFRYTEMALIVVGTIVYLASSKYEFWKGAGLGILIQASVVLTLDYFAERRGAVYVEYLNSIDNE